MTRITFPGYTYPQLMKIIQSRLEGIPGNILEPDAIQFASRKVAAVSGDARRVLDICRRAVEIAETQSANEEAHSMTPSRKGRGTELLSSNLDKRSSKVTISTIKQAINEATSTPLQQCLKSLPLSSKLFLAALLARIRRSGIAEGVMGNIIEEARRLGKMADSTAIVELLLTDSCVMMEDDLLRTTQPSARILFRPTSRVHSIGFAALELMEAGIISLESRKGERMGKVHLLIGEDEVKLALRDDDEVRGLGISA